MVEIENTTLTLTLVGVTSALVLYYLTKRDKRYPPGPAAFPFIGCIPQVVWSGSLANFIATNRERFGNVFTFESGGNKRVVVSGYDAIHQLLIKHADYTSTRATSSMTPLIQEKAVKTPGVFWAPFPQWKVLRSFAIASMREDGMGKASLEPQLAEEIESYLSHFIEPNLGRPIEMTAGLCQATNNVISQMMFGRRSDYDDEKFQTMISAVNETMEISVTLAMFANLPFGKYLVKSTVEREKYLGDELMLPALRGYINEHKPELDQENPRDMVDKFLIYSNKESEKGVTDSSFSDGNAETLAIQMYIAGTETTSTALRWALLYMCLHPEVKVKVQSEISEQIGNRVVTCKDRLHMPYTDAVLLETLRRASIAGTGLPHTLQQDTVVEGVLIPAGADLMLNLDSVLHDEKVFEDPLAFRPERYLSGDIALKKQRTIPFGIGRRSCLGEGLAKMEFFMFFVTFLQKYNISFPEGSNPTDHPKKNSFIVNAPESYEIVFTHK